MNIIDTDSNWTKFRKYFRCMRDINEAKDLDDVPFEVLQAARSHSSPQIELTRVLGITDRLLSGGTPFQYYDSNGTDASMSLEEQLIEFISGCQTGNRSSFTVCLGNGTSILNLRHEGGRVNAQIVYLIRPEEKTLAEAKRLGLEIREPACVSTSEVTEAIKQKNVPYLICLLGDIDEMITGNRLHSYRNRSETSNRQFENHEFEQLKERVEHFFHNITSAQNPFAKLEIKLSSGNSMLVITYQDNNGGGVIGRKTSIEVSPSSDLVVRNRMVTLQNQSKLRDHIVGL